MGLLDLIRRKPVETRSSGTGYSAMIRAERAAYIAGRTGLGELTAAVQASVSLWEAGFVMADVQGADYLDRQTMGMIARALALRGEFVALIGDRLTPAADWDLSTRDGRPVAYRLSIGEAGGGRSQTALAGEVLHVRLAPDPVTPWAGTPPLRRAALTAGLLDALETALAEVYREAPLGSQIVPLPDTNADDTATLRAAFRGRRGQTLVIEGMAAAVAAGQHPQAGQPRQDLSPDIEGSMAVQSLDAARDAIFAAFGVLPALHSRAAVGPVVREAQRHLAAWTLQPIAQLVAEEAAAKLGGAVSIDCILPLQAHDAGGRARALAQIVEALGRARELGLSADDLAAAGKMINFGGGSDLA